ncbi:hypothetical protein PCE1_002256 [Barthelona sp. PCE]
MCIRFFYLFYSNAMSNRQMLYVLAHAKIPAKAISLSETVESVHIDEKFHTVSLLPSGFDAIPHNGSVDFSPHRFVVDEVVGESAIFEKYVKPAVSRTCEGGFGSFAVYGPSETSKLQLLLKKNGLCSHTVNQCLNFVDNARATLPDVKTIRLEASFYLITSNKAYDLLSKGREVTFTGHNGVTEDTAAYFPISDLGDFHILTQMAVKQRRVTTSAVLSQLHRLDDLPPLNNLAAHLGVNLRIRLMKKTLKGVNNLGYMPTSPSKFLWSSKTTGIMSPEVEKHIEYRKFTFLTICHGVGDHFQSHPHALKSVRNDIASIEHCISELYEGRLPAFRESILTMMLKDSMLLHDCIFYGDLSKDLDDIDYNVTVMQMFQRIRNYLGFSLGDVQLLSRLPINFPKGFKPKRPAVVKHITPSKLSQMRESSKQMLFAQDGIDIEKPKMKREDFFESNESMDEDIDLVMTQEIVPMSNQNDRLSVTWNKIKPPSMDDSSLLLSPNQDPVTPKPLLKVKSSHLTAVENHNEEPVVRKSKDVVDESPMTSSFLSQISPINDGEMHGEDALGKTSKFGTINQFLNSVYDVEELPNEEENLKDFHTGASISNRFISSSEEPSPFVVEKEIVSEPVHEQEVLTERIESQKEKGSMPTVLYKTVTNQVEKRVDDIHKENSVAPRDKSYRNEQSTLTGFSSNLSEKAEKKKQLEHESAAKDVFKDQTSSIEGKKTAYMPFNAGKSLSSNKDKTVTLPNTNVENRKMLAPETDFMKRMVDIEQNRKSRSVQERLRSVTQQNRQALDDAILRSAQKPVYSKKVDVISPTIVKKHKHRLNFDPPTPSRGIGFNAELTDMDTRYIEDQKIANTQSTREGHKSMLIPEDPGVLKPSYSTNSFTSVHANTQDDRMGALNDQFGTHYDHIDTRYNDRSFDRTDSVRKNISKRMIESKGDTPKNSRAVSQVLPSVSPVFRTTSSNNYYYEKKNISKVDEYTHNVEVDTLERKIGAKTAEISSLSSLVAQQEKELVELRKLCSLQNVEIETLKKEIFILQSSGEASIALETELMEVRRALNAEIELNTEYKQRLHVSERQNSMHVHEKQQLKKELNDQVGFCTKYRERLFELRRELSHK